MAKKIHQIAGQADREIRKIHAMHGWKFFAPSYFVTLKLGSMEEVVAALTALEEMGHLVSRATVRCDEGHEVWTGTSAEVGDHEHDQCPSSEHDEPAFGATIDLTFELAPDYLAELETSSQKKTRQNH